jgi:hypothetical protein
MEKTAMETHDDNWPRECARLLGWDLPQLHDDMEDEEVRSHLEAAGVECRFKWEWRDESLGTTWKVLEVNHSTLGWVSFFDADLATEG